MRSASFSPLALICFNARLRIIEPSHAVRAQLLFALFLALASGTPISIAFGPAALIYLFILSMPIRRW